MSDSRQPAIPPSQTPITNTEAGSSQAAAFPSPPDAIFSDPAPEPSQRGLIIGILGIAILAIAGGLLLGRHKASPAPPPNTILAAAPAASNIAFSQLAMSQSTSLSGGTSTFLDGHIRNTGATTLTAATVQVIFRNDVNLSPQVESLPLSVIRTRQPYVDTEPLSAAPLKPGQEAEFRLIFESIPDNWNQQMPEVHIVRASLQ